MRSSAPYAALPEWICDRTGKAISIPLKRGTPQCQCQACKMEREIKRLHRLGEQHQKSIAHLRLPTLVEVNETLTMRLKETQLELKKKIRGIYYLIKKKISAAEVEVDDFASAWRAERNHKGRKRLRVIYTYLNGCMCYHSKHDNFYYQRSGREHRAITSLRFYRFSWWGDPDGKTIHWFMRKRKEIEWLRI